MRTPVERYGPIPEGIVELGALTDDMVPEMHIQMVGLLVRDAGAFLKSNWDPNMSAHGSNLRV